MKRIFLLAAVVLITGSLAWAEDSATDSSLQVQAEAPDLADQSTEQIKKTYPNITEDEVQKFREMRKKNLNGKDFTDFSHFQEKHPQYTREDYEKMKALHEKYPSLNRGQLKGAIDHPERFRKWAENQKDQRDNMNDKREDVKDRREDVRDGRQDIHERRSDRRDLHQDIREGDSRREIKADIRQIHGDTHEIRQDRRDIRGDTRDIRADRDENTREPRERMNHRSSGGGSRGR